ncbi:replication endonuclease [Colwellia sp. MB02u-14]|uniref:replication endonuclease n=1 Tax=Colwellia sp. MB02u-14 TaxID=2759815 RepID=UPI0038558C1A
MRGDVVDLTEMANSYNANPVKPRNELIARLHVFEVYAGKHDYVADFLTTTCPSRMHPVHNSSRAIT